MSAADLSCPHCQAELDAATLFASVDDQRAFARLVQAAHPLRARALHYIALFKPERQRLTLRKQAALLLALLPDLERGAITWKGRDWPAPPRAWAEAIDQMLAARDAARLELPMKSHGYLYAILAGMADKQEAAQEAQAEQQLRSGPRPAHQRGAPLSVADLVPGLQPLQMPSPARPAAAQPAGTSPTVRAMRAAIDRKKADTP